MKKNFIKVLFMTVSALLCSHLWAQGSESVSSEVDRQFETTYFIKVDSGINSRAKNYILGLTSENGTTKITNGFQPTEGYSAFFVCDDNTYYKYDYIDGNVWVECTKKNDKDNLQILYNKVFNRNAVFTTEGNINLLENTSFVEIDESELKEFTTAKNKKFLRSDNKGFLDLYVFNRRKGIFVYAVKIPGTSKVNVLCFRDKQSIAEIKPDNVNENTFYNNFQTWLEKSAEDKIKDPNDSSYKMLSVLIYDTLNKSMRKANGHFANLYNTDSNIIIRKYLHTAMKNNRNVYFSELEKQIKPIISSKLESVEKNDREAIVKEAQKYSDYSDEKNKHGLPYLGNGFDTPKTLNNKLNKNKNAKGGCDDIGFLNGVLYSSNIKTYVPNKSLNQVYTEYSNAISKSNSYNIGDQLIGFNDLNKISMPVSDVTEALVGDIVIFEPITARNNGESVSIFQKKKKIGIIIEAPNCDQKYGTNQRQSLGNLTVVWMNEEKGAEKTKLSQIWKTDDGFNIPKYTEIRRILKIGNSTSVNTNWNVYDNKITDTSVEINWMHENTQVSSEQFRWIPNTGEYLLLEKIKFYAYNQLGVSVKGGSWRVYLSGAKDRDWKEGNTQGNIYNNSNCKFEIQLADKTGILQKNNTDKSRYDISWTNATSTYDTEFIIDSDNLLYYYDYSMYYGVKRPVELKIRPESAEAARPGDDLLLEFTLREINTDKKFTITVPANNYIAVYDKKTLWRANLYLNKSENSLDGEDWNNAHPWNAPNSDSYDSSVWFGKNDWNTANGGQCDIKDWTAIYNSNVSNSVAYGYGCGQTVKEFNDGLDNQSLAMKKMNDNNASYPPEGTTFSEGQTTAPGHQWKNYIFPADTSQYKYDGLKLLNKEPGDFFKSGTGDSIAKIPGFSTWWLSKEVKDTDNYYNAAQCPYTLGLDCSGLVHRCTLYPDTKYKTNSKGESIESHTINATRFINEFSYSIQSDNWVLSDQDATKEQKTLQKELISHAVPGDILVKKGHVVYVQDINYPLTSDRITDYSQIDIIHSTQGGRTQSNQWNVQKGDWNELGTNKILYKLQRLIMKD